MPGVFTEEFLIAVLAAAVRMGAPILFAAFGEIFAERSGVINLGVEGMMIMGTLAGFIGAYFTGNLWVGVLLGMIAGGLMSLIHAFLSITLRANQVISGIVLTFFGLGLTGFIGKSMIGQTVPSFGPIHIPVLGDIPVVGPVFFQQNILVYLAFILVPLTWVILFRTRLGLEIRAVGENPMAADSLGVDVYRIRYLCVFIGGILAGLGGAFLSLAYTHMWIEGMTAGRGWIAIAVVIFSMWRPQWALIGAFLFGGVDAFQLRLQAIGIGIPYHILMMMPYVVTIIVLVIVSTGARRKKIGAPASLGVPYIRGEKG